MIIIAFLYHLNFKMMVSTFLPRTFQFVHDPIVHLIVISIYTDLFSLLTCAIFYGGTISSLSLYCQNLAHSWNMVGAGWTFDGLNWSGQTYPEPAPITVCTFSNDFYFTQFQVIIIPIYSFFNIKLCSFMSKWPRHIHCQTINLVE